MLDSKEKTKAESLDSLFHFLNADVQSKRDSEFIGLILEYAKWLSVHASKYSVLDFGERYNLYSQDILCPSSQTVQSERKNLFVEIQSHLRSKLEMIISGTNDIGSALIEIKGTLKLSLGNEPKVFVEEFQLEGVNQDFGLDLGHEKLLADLVFSEMIREFDLKPDRFRKCKRCKKIFYQPTEKKKEFCSTKCGNASRQAEWMKKKKTVKPKRGKKAKPS